MSCLFTCLFPELALNIRLMILLEKGTLIDDLLINDRKCTRLALLAVRCHLLLRLYYVNVLPCSERILVFAEISLQCHSYLNQIQSEFAAACVT